MLHDNVIFSEFKFDCSLNIENVDGLLRKISIECDFFIRNSGRNKNKIIKSVKVVHRDDWDREKIDIEIERVIVSEM